jgi:hypothetical protein
MKISSTVAAVKQEEDTETVVISKGNGSERRQSSSSAKKRRSRGRLLLSHHTKHYVEHDYHDHYHDPIKMEAPIIEPEVEDEGSKKRRGHRGGVATPFPEKLHYMLSKMDGEGTTGIVTWQPHGRCFMVQKSREFVDEIMPRYVNKVTMDR